ncbi:MAG: hypothetical protein EBY08_05285, partial [Actinobacteria bacterium]|nr:hypothetical protein [Actinomycetota bacterium]
MVAEPELRSARFFRGDARTRAMPIGTTYSKLKVRSRRYEATATRIRSLLFSGIWRGMRLLQL